MHLMDIITPYHAHSIFVSCSESVESDISVGSCSGDGGNLSSLCLDVSFDKLKRLVLGFSLANSFIILDEPDNSP